jgi:hypothetical protein
MYDCSPIFAISNHFFDGDDFGKVALHVCFARASMLEIIASHDADLIGAGATACFCRSLPSVLGELSCLSG